MCYRYLLAVYDTGTGNTDIEKMVSKMNQLQCFPPVNVLYMYFNTRNIFTGAAIFTSSLRLHNVAACSSIPKVKQGLGAEISYIHHQDQYSMQRKFTFAVFFPPLACHLAQRNNHPWEGKRGEG